MIDHINLVTEYQQFDVMVQQIDCYHKQLAMETYLLNKDYTNAEIRDFFYQEGEINGENKTEENKNQQTANANGTSGGNVQTAGNNGTPANDVKKTETPSAQPAQTSGGDVKQQAGSVNANTAGAGSGEVKQPPAQLQQNAGNNQKQDVVDKSGAPAGGTGNEADGETKEEVDPNKPPETPDENPAEEPQDGKQNEAKNQTFFQKIMATIAKMCQWIAEKANALAEKLFSQANVAKEKQNEQEVVNMYKEGSETSKVIDAIGEAVKGSAGGNGGSAPSSTSTSTSTGATEQGTVTGTPTTDASGTPQGEQHTESYVVTFNKDDGCFYYQEAQGLMNNIIDTAGQIGNKLTPDVDISGVTSAVKDVANAGYHLATAKSGFGNITKMISACPNLENICTAILTAGTFNSAPWKIFSVDEGLSGLDKFSAIGQNALGSFQHDVNDVSKSGFKYDPKVCAVLRQYNHVIKPFFDMFDANSGGALTNETVAKLFEAAGADITMFGLPLPPGLIAAVQNLSGVLKNPALFILVDLIISSIKEWSNPRNMNNNPVDASYSVIIKGAETWANLLQANAKNMLEIVRNRQILDDANRTNEEQVQALDNLDKLFTQEGITDFMQQMFNYGDLQKKGMLIISGLAQKFNGYISKEGTVGNVVFGQIRMKGGEKLKDYTYAADRQVARQNAINDTERMGGDVNSITDEDINLYTKERTFFTKMFTNTLESNSLALKFLEAMSKLQLDVSEWAGCFFHALDSAHDYHVAEAEAAKVANQYNSMDEAIAAMMQKQRDLKASAKRKEDVQASDAQIRPHFDFSDPQQVQQAKQQMSADLLTLNRNQYMEKWNIENNANAIENYITRQQNLANAQQQPPQAQAQPLQSPLRNPFGASPVTA